MFWKTYVYTLIDGCMIWAALAFLRWYDHGLSTETIFMVITTYLLLNTNTNRAKIEMLAQFQKQTVEILEILDKIIK